jgi:hypothetical protein
MNNQPLPFARQNELADLFVEHVTAEIAKARAKWPNNTDTLAALTEEVGELTQAIFHHEQGIVSAAQVWREAVYVAAMALRVATEGNAEMSYRPEDALSELGIVLRS